MENETKRKEKQISLCFEFIIFIWDKADKEEKEEEVGIKYTRVSTCITVAEKKETTNHETQNWKIIRRELLL